MFRAIALGLADLAHGKVLRILLQALAVTLLIFVVLGALVMWLLSGVDPCGGVGMGIVSA